VCPHRQKTATRHLGDLQNPPDGLHDNHRQAPTIIQFLNIHDNTHQVVSKVDVGTPLFQPFPPRLGFHKYEQVRLCAFPKSATLFTVPGALDDVHGRH